MASNLSFRLLPRSLGAAAIAFAGLIGPAQAQERDMLNVSYDIARELYAALNPVFIENWAGETGETLTIEQSHAGSSKQARAILQGLKADLVTFNQVLDVQILAENGFVDEDWQQDLPNNASPYYSLPAFLVRGGNPKGIEDWDDLARDDVSIVFPNPKTSGNARYTYLAAYAYALNAFEGDDAQAREFVGKVLDNVAVFDTGGRGATTSFVERGIGDVLITFEAEVENIRAAEDEGEYDRVVPQVSLLAEFPVALVRKVAEERGTTDVAEAYLNFLYSTEAQEIIASFNNRVHDPAVVEATADQFPEVELLTVEDVFGSWQEAQETHFSDGGTLDQIQRN
ncbi:thiosulfate ABC transporter substrate-binding protein CysP [Paracoccus aerodenitrificans]|uniref:thiosulfate ABC transporter substrate-binding protein CysP n=1 Tax=Paracoccus aerodenitrificans TaxID=3017781 RepID=UPI0022F102D9|nr:thiosulfate ABC transporter substrate-binding protein CysP [Paracoccus aerodenitrificans]WBU62717.1 thiosulfate ABC transporter substrate-binding protein CysP [Paracoccus aerodenitrificans]